MKNQLKSLRSKIKTLLIFLRMHSQMRKLIIKFKPYTPWNIKKHLKILSFYSQFISKNELCFDIGANIGNFTRYFLDLGAKIVCVEPQIDCLKILYDLYGKNKKVTIIGKAIGDK